MKIKELGVLVFVFGLTLLASTNTFAQSQEKKERKGPPTIKELFKMMDKNEDAKLSKEEVKGPLAKDFDKIDTDEDGFLTAEELKKAPKPKRREDRKEEGEK